MNDQASSNNPYLAIGVRPFINCCSVRTMHGGSLMLPQVRAAMAAINTSGALPTMAGMAWCSLTQKRS